MANGTIGSVMITQQQIEERAAEKCGEYHSK